VDEIHFHEVGAVDAIVDIVGAVIGLEELNVDEIRVSRLHLGSGFVECAHGRLPVPPPAVAELVKGIPVYASDIQGELVTPTGAALLTTLASGSDRSRTSGSNRWLRCRVQGPAHSEPPAAGHR